MLERETTLLLTMLFEKILANKGAIIRGGFSITSTTHIVQIKIARNEKMIMSLIKESMSRSMLEICRYAKSNMLVDLLGRMHELAMKAHSVGDI